MSNPRARRGSAAVKQGKVVKILDPVVGVEMREHVADAGRKPEPKPFGRDKTFAKLAGRRLQDVAKVAKALMDAEPEADALAEIGVGGPDLAREAIEKQTKVVRPALAGIEIEIQAGLPRQADRGEI